MVATLSMAGTPVEATIAAKKTKRNRMVFIPRLRERPTSLSVHLQLSAAAAAGFDARGEYSSTMKKSTCIHNPGT